MKPLVLDGSTCRRNHSLAVVVVILSQLLCLFLYNSFTQAADDQTTKAVRRSSSDQKRVALVIGNSDYKDMPLRNPAHDADDIAKVLRELGFTVQIKINANQKEMEDAVRYFVGEIQNGDVGLFYFSGHGVQVSGENYLIPVGGSIETETDCRYRAVNAGLILGKMEESRNRTNIFILDACRNNPFKGFRSMSKGLTMMDAPVGTFIAYATAPGSVAADGTDRNNPYAKHLILAMKSKGIKIEDVFKEVLREVTRETEGKQVPWIASSLREDFYFNPDDNSWPVSTPIVTPPPEPARPHQASLPAPTPTRLDTGKEKARTPDYKELSRFLEGMKTVKKNDSQGLKDGQLVDGAIEEMLQAVDATDALRKKVGALRQEIVSVPGSKPDYRALKRFGEAMRMIQKEHSVSDKQLIDAALKGMHRSLDANSHTR